MTTDGLREPTTRADEGDTVRSGSRAEARPTTTVPVIPLWERLRGGGDG
ncbi:hypothetical protein ABZ568_33900 [Streptomyces olindensis]|uniref:Uncharacterized protein n=1 Tax=Streptomyces olindensis TaxID=358823 RepID=A0ABV2Y4Y8_9ACTN